MILKYDWSECSAYSFPGKAVAAAMIADLIANCAEEKIPFLEERAEWIANKGAGIWKIRFNELEGVAENIEVRAARGLSQGAALVEPSKNAASFADLFGGY